MAKKKSRPSLSKRQFQEKEQVEAIPPPPIPESETLKIVRKFRLTEPPPDPQFPPPLIEYAKPDPLAPKVPKIVPIDPVFKVDTRPVFHDQYVAASILNRVQSLAAELAKRKLEALNFYEPLPVQAEFHKSPTVYRLLRGSNRSGKTLCAAVEVARMVTSQDPFKKFPMVNGTLFIVGKDEKHLAKVIYEKLFKPNSFRIIRDVNTNQWRAFRPWSYEDANRELETKPAPALIPKRFIKEIAWKDKKLNVPAVVRLTTGWDMHFYSSLGKPPQGSPIDCFWFDEEIVDPEWLPEMQARIVDRRGKGIWSCTPQAGTDQLYELHERAEKERATLPESVRRIKEFIVLLADNKYTSDQAKKDFISDLNEEQIRVRVLGEYAILSYKVYPNFSTITHAHEDRPIPSDWTRYAYVDPGHRTCAVLFVAVPPPPSDYVVLYDELYILEANAAIFAEQMKRKCDGQTFQAFIIDANMAMHTEVGIGKNVMQQYTESLQKVGVKSKMSGSSFLFANDDVMAGVLAVQGMISVRGEKGPRLRVILTRVPNFIHEIKHYHRAKVGGVIQQKPDQRKDNHLMDCLRYMAMHEPRYVKPEAQKPGERGSLAAFRKKLQKNQEQDGGSVINLGPGGRFY